MGYDRDLELTKTKNVKTESGVYIFEKLDRERQIKKMHATLLDQDSDYESLRLKKRDNKIPHVEL